MLLPPANEVCEGYVFIGVCLSMGGAGTCMAGKACVAEEVCMAGGVGGGGMCGGGGGVHSCS